MADFEKILPTAQESAKPGKQRFNYKNPLGFRVVSFDEDRVQKDYNAVSSWTTITAGFLLTVFSILGIVIDPRFLFFAFIGPIFPSIIGLMTATGTLDEFERNDIKHALKNEAQKAIKNNEYEVDLYKTVLNSSTFIKEKDIKKWNESHILWVQKEWDKALTEVVHEIAQESSREDNKSKLQAIGKRDEEILKKMTYFVSSLEDIRKEDHNYRKELEKPEQVRFQEKFEQLVRDSAKDIKEKEKASGVS